MTDAAEDLRVRRLRELALRAHHSGAPQFTCFLEPPEEIRARSAANEAESHVYFYGGYDGAERCVAGFSDEEPDGADFPIACLELRWNAKFASPEHRDLLGAVMGLGIERDAVGDIAFGAEAGTAYLFVRDDMAGYICASLESAGRAHLSVARAAQPPRIREPEGTLIRVTVSSERMDAVLAEGCSLSRAQAQKLIAQGLVKRNHAVELRGDIHLEAGDLLSVRGYGRIRVQSLDGNTRKGRRAVRLFKYT